MSELIDAVKLLEDALNERKNLDKLIDRLENGLFDLLQRKRMGMPTAKLPTLPRKTGRPKGRKDSKPRAAHGTRFAIPKVPFSQLSPTQQSELKREWGKRGKAVAMANRAAKQNGNAVAAE